MTRKIEHRSGIYYLRQYGKSPYWHIAYQDKLSGQQVRYSLKTKELEQAYLRALDWIETNGGCEEERATNYKLLTALDRYWKQHGQHVRSAAAIEVHIAKCKTFPRFKNAMIADFKPRLQKEFVDWLRRQVSERTDEPYSANYIRKIVNTVRTALNYVHSMGEVDRVPVIRLPDKQDVERGRLTIKEMARLFDACESEHLLMFCLLATNTLGRPEAILELQHFQVDYDSRLIDLNPHGRKQTKKYRPVVPITGTLLPWLRKTQRAAESEYLVHYNGKPIKSVRTAFGRLVERAGLEKRVTPYTLRHTMATELRKRGVPWAEIQGMLGHSMSGITDVYAKYHPDYLGEAARAIDEYFQAMAKFGDRPIVLKVLSGSDSQKSSRR